ncbi:MAG TPA: glycosyl hydrolase family 18 protein [Bacteroidales bacterium]|jgi:spore germination protein YaaH|nr:glycosyl hydrolase family 18 protein [Bacteroidales bacterium]
MTKKVLLFLAVMLLLPLGGCATAKKTSEPAKNSRIVTPWLLYRDENDWKKLEPFKDIISSVSLHTRKSADPERSYFDKFHEMGIEVYKLVGAHDPSEFSDDAKIEESISHYLKLCTENGYDGIDLDFESIPTEYQQRYTKFMRELSGQLHSKGKKLSICVGLWHGLFDKGDVDVFHQPDVIAETCDLVRVMGYDAYYSPMGNAADGIAPTSTYPYNREAMQLLQKWIPKEKLILGLPGYGNDYDMTPGGKGRQMTGKPRVQEGSQADYRWLWYEKMSLYRYVNANDGKPHLYFAADARAISWQLRIVDDQKLAGIGFWHFDMVQPEVWSAVRDWLNGNNIPK